eukprot:TRINITY_DN5006_c0_g1_i2.p1 TRINITY_DN5006_c0_g1~~TRINITY_DN5006_c0_g1_i2.p1  ORF type:complete len:321 (+),score=61.89 TRINITY_DN5006_c0_g1_i2:249-1211(+)
MVILVQLRQDIFFLKKTTAAAAQPMPIAEIGIGEPQPSGILPASDSIADGALLASEKMSVFTANFVNDLLFVVGALLLRAAQYQDNKTSSYSDPAILLNLIQAGLSLIRLASKSLFAFMFFHRHLSSFIRPQYLVKLEDLNCCGRLFIRCFWLAASYWMVLCCTAIIVIVFKFRPTNTGASQAVMGATFGFALLWMAYFIAYFLVSIKIYVIALFCCPAQCKNTRIIDCCVVTVCPAAQPRTPHPEQTRYDTEPDLRNCELAVALCLFGPWFAKGVKPGFWRWMFPCVACCCCCNRGAPISSTVPKPKAATLAPAQATMV